MATYQSPQLKSNFECKINAASIRLSS